MPTPKTPADVTPPESPRTPLQANPKSGRPGVRDVMIRNLPEDAYEILRRVAFDSGGTHGDVLAYALREAVRYGDKLGGGEDLDPIEEAAIKLSWERAANR